MITPSGCVLIVILGKAGMTIQLLAAGRGRPYGIRLPVFGGMC